MVNLNIPKNPHMILDVLYPLIRDSGIDVVQSNKLSLCFDDGSIVTNINPLLHSLSRKIQSNSKNLDSSFFSDCSDWIDEIYKEDISKQAKIEDICAKVNEKLTKKQFLSNDSLSFADLCALTFFEKSRKFKTIEKSTSFINWIERCLSHPLLINVYFNNIKPEVKYCTLEEGGRFVALPNAVHGNVTVRFPPEASGYLHIGHAKAALLNQFYREKYNGNLILRFDDTNPLKETKIFEQIILEDASMLGLTPDKYSHTSHHFEAILKFATILIQKGLAYCDDSLKEAICSQRANKLASPYRELSVNENLKIWERMQKGEASSWCLRAKIDFESNNGCLRDPTIYRSCREPHPSTGTKYKIYPTYDFACPIVDSIEGVTHALRTSEYKDRDPQYRWMLTSLELRIPEIFEFSRLNMQYTVLSKRKLSKLVEAGLVNSWDDPRMPTVRGLMRHGLTQPALREYIIAQGFSKTDTNVSPDKVWAFNKRMVEPKAPVLVALHSKDIVNVIVHGTFSSSSDVPLIPKSPSQGSRKYFYDSNIVIESADANLLVDNSVVTLINWGNARVHKTPTSLEFTLETENRDFSSTLKLSWLPFSQQSTQLVPITLLSYSNLLTKPSLLPEDKVEDFVNANSCSSVEALGESFFKTLKKGDIIQIIRKALFICDIPHSESSKLTLIEIPSGRVQPSTSATTSKPQTKAPKKEKKDPQPIKTTSNASQNGSKTQAQKKTKLGLSVKKNEDFSQWYTETLTKSEMLEYYNVSGCYIIRPHAYSVWEKIQSSIDSEIKKLGVENCYFPLFVSESSLAREKDHISGFAPEVAWVTRAGESDLPEPIAIRPTSETVIYPQIARWVQSHRDLPMKLNQWCNVVRWEFKNPTPFLRTREFLWQEGHTIFANRDEAVAEVYKILDIYARVYEELLAIPVVKGIKTDAEKFAGAEFTTTLEGYIPLAGRGLQCATSHHLGQNFSKMFEIGFENPDGSGHQFAFQNSWGLSTRSIGAMVMVHGDDKGLVLPPKVSPIQVVIIPCGLPAQSTQEVRDLLLAYCDKIVKILSDSNIRVHLDARDHVTSGWRFNYWEQKGIPIRIEVGPKDLQNSSVVLVRRDNLEKISFLFNGLAEFTAQMLETIHTSLFDKASSIMKSNSCISNTWKEFTEMLEEKKLIYIPFCGDIECEDMIRTESASESQEPDGKGKFKTIINMGAKSLCIPLEQPIIIKNEKCLRQKCNKKAKFYVLFGRSF